MSEHLQPSQPGFLPEQERSVSKELSHSIECATQDDAEEEFLDAKDRLLQVNDWHSLAGSASASFLLCDSHGKPVTRTPRIGDLIRISIPGPGHANSGDNDDWVQVEEVAYDDFPDEDRERIAMVGSSRVDLQACKLEYSIVSPK